ncbi:PQQ-binding-like beta-propeller repeat protein [Halorubrum sp. CSM-61]|uniref:outer membrane protein assembly factor BamB family protein n=1 Tax=Halorubrum sp. CSM-61 TaxID=2485838 RepID=UPI000F4BBA06|nr:PQQ-binding-like beta-propeller repeat protein [Halorubrum sp. CSM-61]
MTDRNPARGATRRRFLAAAGSGVAGALAGCGYRPGGGDLAWESSLDTGGLLGPGATRFAVAPDRLFAVRNQSGRTYDFDAETWRNVENASVTAVDGSGTTRLDAETERQAVAPPAVTETSVVVPVEGGRVTAIDREAAGFDPGAREPTGGTESEEAEADDVRWRADVVESEGGESNEPEGANESTSSPGIDGVRASARLVVAVAETDLVALDAETGDPAFRVTGAWPDGDGSADRIAVDGDDVWAGVAATGSEGRSEGGSNDGGTVFARFGSTGERRVTRSLSADADWLAVAGDTIVMGEAGDRLVGYDRDLARRFELHEGSLPGRPQVVSADGSRFYYSTGGTVRAVDAAAGELSWERSDLPGGPVAVDQEGMYVAENGSGFGTESQSRTVAVGADGEDRWRAPLPEGVGVDELFAVGGRLIVVDDGELYGLHATPGERWSLVG